MIDFLSVGAALAVVLTLAYAAVWLLRRIQPKGGGGPHALFLRATPVGPRERVVTLEWRGEVLLLGVTSQAITLIDRAPSPAEPAHGAPIDDVRSKVRPWLIRSRAAGERPAS